MSQRTNHDNKLDKKKQCLFGIAGQARMGKDTIGDILKSRTPHLEKRAFSREVKNLICSVFDVTHEFIETWKVIDENPPSFDTTMRKTLQIVGDGLRAVKNNVWVEKELSRSNEGIFCDVRYSNEANEISKHGGTNILVGRSAMINNDSNASEFFFRDTIIWFLQNTSENVVNIKSMDCIPEKADTFHWFIRNDGSIDDLYVSVISIFNYQKK